MDPARLRFTPAFGVRAGRKLWADLGSGGGFPGVVLACALAETPGATVHLVERNAKKAAFLREALRLTASPGIVHLAEIGDTVDRITGPG